MPWALRNGSLDPTRWLKHVRHCPDRATLACSKTLACPCLPTPPCRRQDQEPCRYGIWAELLQLLAQEEHRPLPGVCAGTSSERWSARKAMEPTAALQAVLSGLKICLESMASSPTAIGHGLSKPTSFVSVTERLESIKQVKEMRSDLKERADLTAVGLNSCLNPAASLNCSHSPPAMPLGRCTRGCCR